MSLKTGVVRAHSAHRMLAYTANNGKRMKHRQFAMAEGEWIPGTVMGKHSVASAHSPKIAELAALQRSIGTRESEEIYLYTQAGTIPLEEGERQLRALKQKSS